MLVVIVSCEYEEVGENEGLLLEYLWMELELGLSG